MEDNKHFYEEEYAQLSSKTTELESQLKAKDEKIKKQELLLEELYKLVYYKRAWLSLSDDNVEGMKKVIDTIPQEDRIAPSSQTESEQLELSFDENPWGV